MQVTHGLFITGTDTRVGKTVVACALLRNWTAQGRRAVGMKPVAAGIAAGAACNEDVAALAAAGNVEAPLELRNPFAFAPAIAPHLAVQMKQGIQHARQPARRSLRPAVRRCRQCLR